MNVRNYPLATRCVNGIMAFFLLALACWRMVFAETFDSYAIMTDLVTCLLFTITLFLASKELSHSKTRARLEVLSLLPFGSAMALLGYVSPWMHLLLFLKLPAVTRKLADRKFLAPFPQLRNRYEMTMIFLLVLGILHVFSTIWIALSPVSNDDTVTKYIKALYWTVTTVATVGYGDITPNSNESRIFAMGVMLFGVGFYGFIISKISTIIFQKDRREQSHAEKMEHLSAFLEHYRIPPALRQEVYGFYEHRLREQSNTEEEQFLSELPEPLRAELQTYLNIGPISRTQIFSNCSESCLRAAADLLDHRVVAPGEKIVSHGEIGQVMYIIGHGQVAVMVNGQSVATLGKGNCFGEMSLISQERRNADVVAQGYCDLYVLTLDKFNRLVADYQDLRSNIERIVANRAKQQAA